MKKYRLFKDNISLVGLLPKEMTLPNYLLVRISALGFAKKCSNLDNQNVVPKNARDNVIPYWENGHLLLLIKEFCFYSEIHGFGTRYLDDYF